MGDHEGWVQPPSGLLPNGLLPNEAANVLQVLDSVRWSKAEERTAELIASIQPNAPSEGRRNAVAEYVKRLIMKCFPCQVFTFGSVPLKTYLPDGDIDLTAFSKNQNLKDTWAHQVRDMLESEEKSQNAEFRVKEVQYIQAEVKIIKCLVENIVVDISFNQLGGLCTLCFLEEVDNLINHNYLFKRSIILIKAWCYYESRILGAHHGLISTYALEALVLYIFHVYNNSFSGPLEVLYRFLEFFSKFDWDNFCVSLWGPVPISSLPDVTAKPPRKDSGDLLLSKEFLESCGSTYAVFPGGQENQGQPFVSKHFNVIDPLRVNNNLGRSVSKGNFFRIRSAFAFGAKRLARLLECSEKDISFEINQFFMNTWERHGSGHRPDAPSNDLCYSRLPKSEQLNESEGPKNKSSDRGNVFSSFKSQGVGVRQSHSLNSRQDHSLLETTSRNSNVSTTSRVQAESRGGDQDNSKFEQRKNEINVNQSTINKIQQCSANDIQGRFLVVRTYSSPELTDSYGEVSSLVRHNKTPEGVKTRTSMRMDFSGRKKPELSSLTHTSIRPSTDYRSTIGHDLSRNNLDVVVDINNYPDDSESSVVGEDSSPGVGAQGMHEEEQDHVNLIGSSMAHSFNGLVHVPLNMGSGHLQFPILPSVLDSMGFGQRNFSGMVPPNIPLLETSWGSNVHFPHGLMSSPLSHYFPGMGLNSSLEDPIEPANGNSGCVERSSREADDEFCHEQDRDSIGGFDTDNGAIEMPRSDNKLQSTSGAYNFSPSRRSLPGNYKRVQQKFTKENQGPISEEHGNHFQYQDDTGNEIHVDDRIASSRSSPVARTSSVRSKTTSESSWDGSSAKVSKSVREKRGRKTAYLVVQSSANGKGKSVSEQSSSQIDEDNRDAGRTEMAERSIGPQSVSSLHLQRHEVPGYEMAQSSGSEPILPLGPVLIGPPSQQRGLDSGAVPFAFYPTGPPIPFVTMVPFYNFPSEGTSDASTSHFSGHEVADSDSGQNFDSSVRHDQPEVLSTLSPRTATSMEPSECNGGNILNSDFPSHLQNLQYGRSCQNSRFPSVISPSPVAVPPMYLQGRYPWDGPGRPLSGNMNPITLSYGSRVVPVAPFQSVSNRPTSVYQHYTDEMPRYRSGTGTYLPNPKMTGRDRHSTSGHSTSGRRGHYNLGDHQGDKEDNWNVAKSRGAGRSHGRNQAEKTNLRMNANENRAERPWGSRHDSHPPYKSQSGPLHHSNATQSGSVAYGMYPLRGINPSALSSNGPSIPSVVMLYPYDHSSSYASPAEQLEFGSLGPIGFSSIGEAPQLNEGSRMGSTLDDQRFHGSPAPQSSPDQPSPNS